MGEYEPADWLIAAGVALCGMAFVGVCLWQALESL